MKVFYGFDSLPRFSHPAVTVGSYDGVHLGHRALIERLLEEAHATHGESIVVTFDPHPRIALGKSEGLRLLTTPDEKIRLLEELGVEVLIVVRFDSAFAALSGTEFVDRYLIGVVGAATIVAGYNHRFGHDRISCAELSGRGVKIVEVPACEVDGHRVSSTTIRRSIEAGDRMLAERLLGHPLHDDTTRTSHDER